MPAAERPPVFCILGFEDTGAHPGLRNGRNCSDRELRTRAFTLMRTQKSFLLAFLCVATAPHAGAFAADSPLLLSENLRSNHTVSTNPAVTDPALARSLARLLMASSDTNATVRDFLIRHESALPQSSAAREKWFRGAVSVLPANLRGDALAAYNSLSSSSDSSIGSPSSGGPSMTRTSVAPPRGGAAGVGGSSGAGSGSQNSTSSAFVSNPRGRTSPPVGSRLSGIVGWRSTPRLMDIQAEAGAAGGLYRRMVFLNDTDSSRYIGEDFAQARRIGMRTWLTCVGSPSALSPHPELTQNEFGTGLPEYARYAPTDAAAWANLVIAFVDDMQLTYGAAPDYIELWNEPERAEWFTGTSAELLQFYSSAASRIRLLRPAIKVGGPGLAGSRSTMDGTESVLLALVRHASASGAPLDFVSWHHYAPANELLFSQTVSAVDSLGASLGLPAFETVVSEWNIYPSAQGAVGPEFDGSHSAANYAGFITTAAELGLDGNMFFLDQDEDNDPGVTDLSGVGLGAITMHGIKKPVMHLMEILLGMSKEATLPVVAPVDEFSVRIAATRSGSRARYVISNDCVGGTWLFVNRSRQYGMDPGWLNPRWQAAGGSRATEQTLIAQGLTLEQAQAVLSFIPGVLEAEANSTQTRTVSLQMLGNKPFTLGEVRRFTSTVNAPANFRLSVWPQILAAAAAAGFRSAETGSAYLSTMGYVFSTAEVLANAGRFFAWASESGVPYGYAVTCWKLMQDTLRDERLASSASLNALPGISVAVENSASAGITVSGREILIPIEPNSVIVLDLRL